MHKLTLWCRISIESSTGDYFLCQNTRTLHLSLLVTPWLVLTWWGQHWWPLRATASRAPRTSWPLSASPRPRPASPRTPMCSNWNAHAPLTNIYLFAHFGIFEHRTLTSLRGIFLAGLFLAKEMLHSGLRGQFLWKCSQAATKQKHWICIYIFYRI